jgi:hypothetical protein
MQPGSYWIAAELRCLLAFYDVVSLNAARMSK